ncbi:hypothetical protein T484DRAFT_1954730 [Baffinella frigidus]|nr:hypothetical protein T484DRAFT_1954730 [Cryptophyta sp. CCMP2293]
MLLGNLPDKWGDKSELQLFVLVYILLIFFLVQNFLLAIIVEAYMATRQGYVALQTEEEFPVDVWNSYASHVLARWHGWPSRTVLGTEMMLWTSRLSVRYEDLRRTKLFRRDDSIKAFVRWYSKYDFLDVPEVRHKAPPKPGMEIADEVEERISRLLGKKLPTLKQMAREDFIKAARRASLRGGIALDPPQLESPDASKPVTIDALQLGRAPTSTLPTPLVAAEACLASDAIDIGAEGPEEHLAAEQTSPSGEALPAGHSTPLQRAASAEQRREWPQWPEDEAVWRSRSGPYQTSSCVGPEREYE